ncbi:MAG: hypothetical protein HYW49_00020 [Deltaproteobacteria bacterium]|nr:hypothetical protein [Deltaproteobacteria bacterium]
MNQKSTAIATLDLRVHYKFDLVKLLKWLLPALVAVFKLPSALHFAGP